MSMFHLLFRPETQKAHASVVRSGNSLFPDNRAARNPSFPLAMKAAAQHDTRPTATENGNDVGAASASNSGDLFVSHALSGTSRTRPGVASFQTGSSQGSRNDRTQEPSAAPTTAFKEPPTEIPLGEDTGAIFRSDRKSFPLHDETDATETSDTAKIIGVPSESASDSQIVRSAETVAALLSAGSDTVDSAVTPAAAPEWPQPRNTDAEPGPQPAPTPANDANAAVAPRHATDAPLQTDSAAVRPAAASPSPQPALTRFATATERPEPRNTGAEPGPQPAPTPAPANDADAAVAPRHATDAPLQADSATARPAATASSSPQPAPIRFAAASERPEPRNTNAEPGPQPAPTPAPANDADAAVAPRHATDAPLQADSAAVRPAAAASPSPQPAPIHFAAAPEWPEPRNTGAEAGPQPAPTPASANDADAAVAPRHATDAPLQTDSATARPAAAASPSPQPAPVRFAAAPEWPEPRNTGAETPVAFNAAKPGPVIDETPADRPTARPEADAAPVALPSRVRTSFETPRVRARATGSDATASENESGENGRPLRFASSSATAERDVFSNENDNRQTLAETDGRATMLRARLAASGGQAEGNYFHAAAPGEWNRNVAARALDDAPMSDATAAAAAQRTEHIQSMVARFGDLIAGALTGKGQVMNIRLVPVALGRLSLRCREEQGRLSVEITAETREARAFLTAHESEIRTVVQNSGYRMTHFDVHAQGEDAGRRLFRDREHTGETHDAGRHARHAEQTESAVAPELLGNRAAEPGRLWWVA